MSEREELDEHGMTHSERGTLDDFLEEKLNENRVVLFSKTTCRFCTEAKRLLENEDLSFLAIELDTLGEFGGRLQTRLFVNTGQKTVPNIFISKQHIGGCSDLKEAKATGLLYEYIEGKFYPHYDYDLIVIGGGSGGLAAAKEAAMNGKNVAVCDYVTPTPRGTSWGLGGTCVNVGCIPKKLMHKAALMGEEIETQASYFGWGFNNVGHNWNKLVKNIQEYIQKLNWQYRKELRKNNITYLNNYASFDSDHVIKLSRLDDEENSYIAAKNFILAMGCRPSYLYIPGAKEFCITSDDLFSLSYPPGNTLIVGASYIALECAGFLKGMGFECTVLVRSVILRGFDRTMASKLGTDMENLGVKFVYKWKLEEISMLKQGNPPLLQVRGVDDLGEPFSINFNTVVLAIGRKPNISDVCLDKVRVTTHSVSGKIITNKFDQTTNKTIFAIGDIVHGATELTPVAIQAGILLAKRLYGNSNTLMDYDYIPTTIFTPYEYGCVGLCEEVAKDKYSEVVIYHKSFKPLETVISKNNSRLGYAKLVCVKEGMANKIVGLHVLSPNAGEICQGFALAVKMGISKQDVDSLVGIHPTCAEVFTNLVLLGEDDSQEQGC